MSEFWNNVSSAIEEGDTQKSPRNAIYDLANAAYSISETLKNLPYYFKNCQDWKVTMDHYSLGGYLITLSYYMQTTLNKDKVNTLIKLGLMTSKLEKTIESEKDPNTEKVKEGLSVLLKETMLLLAEEIALSDIGNILKNVQDKRGYLNNFLGIAKTQKRDISGFILKLAL